MFKKNNILIRLYNNSYNSFFKKINKIQIDKSENKNLVKEKINSLEHSTSLHTAWLLNLKRLYVLVKKKIRYKKLPLFRCWVWKWYSSYLCI